eukprot:tig00001333_g8189.t1
MPPAKGRLSGDGPRTRKARLQQEKETGRSLSPQKRSFALSRELHPFLGGPVSPPPALDAAQVATPLASGREESSSQHRRRSVSTDEEDEEDEQGGSTSRAASASEDIMLAALMERSAKLVELSAELETVREELKKVNKLNSSLARVLAAEAPPRRTAYATLSRAGGKSVQDAFAASAQGGTWTTRATSASRRPAAPRRSCRARPWRRRRPAARVAEPAVGAGDRGDGAAASGEPVGAGGGGEERAFVDHLLWLLRRGDPFAQERDLRRPLHEKRAAVVERVRALLGDDGGASDGSDGLRAYWLAPRKLSGASEGSAGDAAFRHAAARCAGDHAGRGQAGADGAGAQRGGLALELGAASGAGSGGSARAAPPPAAPPRPAGQQRGPREALLRMLAEAEAAGAAAAAPRGPAARAALRRSVS